MHGKGGDLPYRRVWEDTETDTDTDATEGIGPTVVTADPEREIAPDLVERLLAEAGDCDLLGEGRLLQQLPQEALERRRFTAPNERAASTWPRLDHGSPGRNWTISPPTSTRPRTSITSTQDTIKRGQFHRMEQSACWQVAAAIR